MMFIISPNKKSWGEGSFRDGSFMSPMDTAAVAFAMPFASIDDRSVWESQLYVSVSWAGEGTFL